MKARFLVTAVALVACSVAAGGAAGWVASSRGDDAPDVVPTQAAAVTASATGIDVAAVVDALEPSVVSIETTVVSGRGPFRAEGQGAGTGVVVDSDGLVLTNAHVVEGARTITVTVDGDARAAELVASDPEVDLALVRVDDADGLVPATFATSGDVAVGDPVVAIGNALALEGGMTVTEGIVSALDRSIETDSTTLTGLIQTDAAISSGNSGGPLVDAQGRVVGINTAVAASSGTVNAANVGFVIPADTVRAFLDRVA